MQFGNISTNINSLCLFVKDVDKCWQKEHYGWMAHNIPTKPVKLFGQATKSSTDKWLLQIYSFILILKQECSINKLTSKLANF